MTWWNDVARTLAPPNRPTVAPAAKTVTFNKLSAQPADRRSVTVAACNVVGLLSSNHVTLGVIMSLVGTRMTSPTRNSVLSFSARLLLVESEKQKELYINWRVDVRSCDVSVCSTVAIQIYRIVYVF